MINKRKALVLIVILIFSWADLSAQLSNDVVYLKNGSVIRGKILWQTSDSIKIETNCKDEIVFEKANLKEIKQEKIDKSNSNPDSKNGLYSYSTFGLLAGNSEADDAFAFSFNTCIGYEFNHLFGVGIGAGIEKLETEIIPVFISFKSNLFDRTNSPTLNFNIGYSIPYSKTKKTDNQEFTYTGGINVGFDLGICSFVTNKSAVTVTAGYQYQIIKGKTNIGYYYWNQNTFETYTYEFNRISVKIGFLFK